jgi:hypothetical protein
VVRSLSNAGRSGAVQCLPGSRASSALTASSNGTKWPIRLSDKECSKRLYAIVAPLYAVEENSNE